MADVKVNISVDDKGSTAKVVVGAKQLSKALSDAATEANRTTLAVDAAKKGVSAYNALRAKTNEPTRDSNISRSIGDGTGSSTRDFAKQAQGLGGLVHLYATFAANIYAVGAAFNALSKAADTANLVKGLDQIGASAGRNLGSIAKQMVAAADGAISLRDAMTATAISSAGGMTNHTIIRMTEVAKKASIALGRDLPDSMNRLTRGIIKNEPELLDELGIMTRLIPAQEAYSRQIGKTVASLTTFEKQQAFTNAVLEEGERKFGSINLDANPYAKVAASIQNLSQSGLELINKVLGPMVSFLSSSPTALSGVLAGMSALLLKQAIPALGMYRDAAKKQVEESFKNVQKIALDNESRLQKGDLIAAEYAERRFQTEKKTLTRISALQASFGKFEVLDPAVSQIVKKSPFAVTEADKQEVARYQAFALNSEDELHQKQADKLKAWNATREKIVLDSATAGDIAQAAYEKSTSKAYSTNILMAQKYEKAVQSSSKAAILAKTSETAAILGPRTAWGLLNEEIAKSKVGMQVLDDGTRVKATGALANGITRVAGAFSIMTAYAGTAADAIAKIGMYVALVIGVFQVLDRIFSTSAKEATAYSTSIDTLNSSFDNISNTLDVISRKSLSEFISVESTQAKSNALSDLTENLGATLRKFQQLQEAQSGWDNFFDGFFDWFGAGSGDKLALGLSNSVVSAFKVMEEGPAKEKAKESIQRILGPKVDLTNVKEFNKVIKDNDIGTLTNIGRNVSDVLNKVSRDAGNAASSLTGFKTALGEVNKQSTTMSSALTPTDDFSKLGSALGVAAASLTTALQDPVHSLEALIELTKDTRTLSLLPANTAAELGKRKKELEDISASLAKLQQQEASASKSVESAQAIVSTSSTKALTKEGKVEAVGSLDQQRALSAAKEELSLVKEQQKTLGTTLLKVQTSARQIAQEMAETSYANLAKGLNKALAEAAITSAKGYLDVLKQAGGNTSKMDVQLDKRAVDLQIANVNALYDNSKRMVGLTLELEKSRLTAEQESLRRTVAERGGTGTAEISTRLAVIAKEMESTDRAIGLFKAGDRAILAAGKAAAAKGVTPEAYEANTAALGKLGSLPTELFGKMQQLAGLFAQKSNLDLQEKAANITKPAGERKDIRDQDNRSLATSAAELENLSKSNSIYSEILQKEKELVANKQLTNKFLQAEEDLNVKISLAKLAADSGKAGSLAAAEASRVIQLAEKDKLKSRETQAKEEAALASSNLQARQAGEAQLAATSRAFSDKQKTLQDEIDSIRKDNQANSLAFFNEMGVLADSEYTKELAKLDLQRESLTYAASLETLAKNRSLAETEITDKIKVQKELLERSTSATSTAVITEQIAALNANLVKTTNSYTEQKSAIDAGNASRVLAINLTTTHKSLMEAQADQMVRMVDVTTNLATAFGTMGDSVGKVGEAILKMAQDEESYLVKKQALEAATAAARDNQKADPAGYEKAIAAEKKAEKDKVKSEVDGISKVANASKKLFSEKTAAYKVMNAVEKAASIYKIALQAKEIALDLKNFAVKVGLIQAEVPLVAGAEAAKTGLVLSAEAATMPAKIAGIYASFMSMLGPFGPPAAALAIAAFIGAFSGGAKGGQVDITGLTSEERQAAQGTGQSYTSGKLVDNGGGVFGDSEAKSTAIVDSLEVIKANSIEGLDYDNKMLKALEILASSVDEAAKSIYSITGLRSGTNFGTMEGISTSGGFGSSIPVIGGLISSVFGGKTSSSTEITSAGIQLKGTFAEVMDDITGSIVQYKDILTKYSKSGGLFSSGKSWSTLTTETQALSESVSGSIAAVFQNASDVFIAIGEKVGITQSTIEGVLSSLDVSTPIDLMGLTGQELIDELNAVIGSQLSTASSLIFSQFAKYKEFGEDYLTTVVRVVNANDKIEMALESIGTAFRAVGNFDVSEIMVKNAGSLSTFMDQASYFKDNFLTAAEQLVPVQKSVNAELTRLGVSTSITKDEFKALVLAQNINTEAGQQMYQSLMELAPGYMSIIQLQEEVATGTSKTYDLTIALLTAEGKTTEALAMTRARELAALSTSDAAIQARIYLLQDEAALLASKSSLEQAIYTALGEAEKALAITREAELKALDASLLPAKMYLYALQDEATLKSKLVTAYNKESSALKTTITALTTSIKTLNDYRTALTVSDKSVSTPAERYQETKRQAAQVAAIASGIATTDAEILAKQDAISKLPSVTDTFLQASKELYASSEQYTQDFNSVLALLDSTGASLVLQQTDAQRQLDALTTNTTILSLIEENTSSVADLLTQYLAAASATEAARQASAASGSIASGALAIPAFASGGLASGIALVGEQGPELVNFTNPGRVYSNKASNDMLNNSELINEIKALRAEVSQLRADQKAQTGHLIASNYDANARTATQVVAATEEAVAQTTWATRSAVKLA